MTGSHLALGAVMAVAGHLAGCSIGAERHTFRELHMGCEARIVIACDDAPRAQRAARAAFDRIASLDRTLSDWSDVSETTRLAERMAASGGTEVISEDLAAALGCALQLWHSTDGRFDPSLGALTRLWREARREGRTPPSEQIEAARKATGADAISLADNTVTFARAGIRLDFGGIGKGFAADAALAVLAAEGCPAALVELGGDLVVGAPPPGELGWRVRIDAADSTIILRPHSAVATSGDREQSLDSEAPRRSHILDPRAGFGMMAAPEITVLVEGTACTPGRSPPHAPLAAPPSAPANTASCGPGSIADALATALSVCEPDQRLKLLERFEGASAWTIKDGRVERLGEAPMPRRRAPADQARPPGPAPAP